MFTIEEIIKIIKGAQVRKRTSAQVINNISTDTRTIKPGDLFIPIKGPNFDGRNFIDAALKKGAFVLEVKDGPKALRQLAAYHRAKFKIPIIGITGSSGKTTTKDMLSSILSEKGLTLKNEGNFNNEIGVPLTLLKLNKKHKFAVIEMAMQRMGEIQELAEIVCPTIAVITNIGEAHLEFLKTKKNIAKAKAEILSGAQHAVLNADDNYFGYLTTKGLRNKRTKIAGFGIIEDADTRTKELKNIKLPVPGDHNVENALAAIAAAKILKIPKKFIKKGLENFKPSGKRSEIIDLPNGVRIINDCYNANPSSMRAALKMLAKEKGRKIAVLGDMLELGSKAKSLHKKIISLTKKLKIDSVLTLGKLWPKKLRTKELLTKELKNLIQPGDVVLIKGSRGMKMEQIVDALTSPE